MKTSIPLPEKLKNYSLLAGSMLASAAANAQVVYTDVSPDSVLDNNGSYYLDLNNDGQADFRLSFSSSGKSWNEFIAGLSYNADMIYYDYEHCSLYSQGIALPFGKSVLFPPDGKLMPSLSNSWNSNWTPHVDFGHSDVYIRCSFAGNDLYYALRFKIAGEYHFGWIRLELSSPGIIVKDYAYEATPNHALFSGVTGCTNYYIDNDQDGYGDSQVHGDSLCSYPGSEYSLNNRDCNDTDALIHPGAIESCNNLDDNCDGQTDEGVQKTFYADVDGDGFGNRNNTTLACTQPGGYVTNNLDCDDSNAAIHPAWASIAWQKSLGGSNDEEAYFIQQTSDSGFIVAGYSNSNDGDVSGNHGQTDYWIVKNSASDSIQWQKSFGGPLYEVPYSIQQTTEGGFIIAGFSEFNGGDVSGNHGNDDYWVVKLDASGNIEWQKSLGGSNNDDAFSIQQITDGGFIVAGYSNSNNDDVSGNHGSNDYWIVKLDSFGNVNWQKSLGGSNDDYATSIQQTTDGGFIVAGYSASNNGDVSGNHGGNDYWIVKLYSSGNIQWRRCLGGSGDDMAKSIQQTSDGGFIVAGSSNSTNSDVSGNHGGYDYWIVKLDSHAFIEWQKSLGGSNDDYATSIHQTTDGGFIVAGYSNSNKGDVSGNHGDYDYWILKLDAAGNIEWQKSLGGSGTDQASSIQQIDSGFIVAGYSSSNDEDVSGNHGGNDYWIVKLKTIPGGTEICNNLDDNCNKGIDEGLNFIKYHQDADGDSYGTSKSSVLACSQPPGYVLDSTDCDDNNRNVNPGAKEIPNNGIDDNCNGLIDEFGTGTNSLDNPAPALSIFPNPTNGTATIQFTLSKSLDVRIKVFDLSGKEVETLLDVRAETGEHSLQLNTSKFSKGVYLVKMITDFGVENSKLIVQ